MSNHQQWKDPSIAPLSFATVAKRSDSDIVKLVHCGAAFMGEIHQPIPPNGTFFFTPAFGGWAYGLKQCFHKNMSELEMTLCGQYNDQLALLYGRKTARLAEAPRLDADPAG